MEYSGKEDIEKLGSKDSYYIANFLDNPDELFNTLNKEIEYIPREELKYKIYGKELPLPRDKQYNKDYIPIVKPWTDTLREIKDKIEIETNQYCNHLVINRYQDGSDHISYHHDKTRDFVDQSNVLTISLGAPRYLYLKRERDNKIQKVILQPGSLFILGPKTNRRWKHAIPKRSINVISEPRISLTYRVMKTRYNPATGEIDEY
jgi:alkylated DNA repair dioxygenase AlkB